MTLSEHVAIRDRLCRRYWQRPGSVERIAAEEFPGIDPADVAAAARHVGCQVTETTLSHALAHVERRDGDGPGRRR